MTESSVNSFSHLRSKRQWLGGDAWPASWGCESAGGHDLLNRHLSSLTETLVQCPLILAFKPLEGPAEKEILTPPNYTQGRQPRQVATRTERFLELGCSVAIAVDLRWSLQLSGAMVLWTVDFCVGLGGFPGEDSQGAALSSAQKSPARSAHTLLGQLAWVLTKATPITPPHMGAVAYTVNPKHPIGWGRKGVNSRPAWDV